jgi:hypothetical protein
VQQTSEGEEAPNCTTGEVDTQSAAGSCESCKEETELEEIPQA